MVSFPGGILRLWSHHLRHGFPLELDVLENPEVTNSTFPAYANPVDSICVGDVC